MRSWPVRRRIDSKGVGAMRTRAIALGAAVLLAAMVTAVPALAAPGDWLMFGDGPAHNSVNRSETVLSTANVSALHVVKSYPKVDPFDSDWAYQLIQGNIGYTVLRGTNGGANEYLTAFNLTTGSRLWRHQISAYGDSWRYVPAISNGIVYVGGDSAMYAYNATTGVKVWITQVGFDDLFNMVTVAGNDVYATTYYGERVYDFNAATGAIRWSRAPAGSALDGPVSVVGGVAYVLNDALYAYDASTGALKYHVGSGQYETPVVSNGVVYTVTRTNLIARHASTGSLIWSKPVPTNGVGGIEQSPTVDGNTVIVSSDRFVVAFNAATGAVRWRVDGGSSSTDYLLSAAANGVVYIAGIGVGLQAVDEATGAVLYSSHSVSCFDPIVSHSRVYATCYPGGTSGEYLQAFGL